MCGMRGHEKCASILKNSRSAQRSEIKFFGKFCSLSPDPFEVFRIGANQLPDLPEEPPLPVIRPPKKRL